MEEKKNGSHAGNASGTVSAVSSLITLHNNTAFSVSQVGIYSKAEEVAVNVVVEKARQSGDLHTYPLSVLADEINDTMRQIVDQANVPAKQGGRELGWPKPK